MPTEIVPPAPDVPPPTRSASPRVRTTAGRKVTDGVHVLFRVSDRVVLRLEPDLETANAQAVENLLGPNAEIIGVVHVGWGDDVQHAIAELLKKHGRA